VTRPLARLTARGHRSVEDYRIDPCDQSLALFRRCNANALEIAVEPDIGEQRVSVLMEVKEGTTSTVKHTARLLLQSSPFAQTLKRGLKSIERRGSGMLHWPICGENGRNGKSETDALPAASCSLTPGAAHSGSIIAKAIAQRRAGE